ncbi:MAG: LacI family DNA-binding transcriptional regulator [Spirochaetes bacterium]|nr:LacI family DNA-binding transcriptional regulator [Spirochaetota bacterium]
MKLQKVTIKDVARLSGFSISTVSHTINNTRFVEKKTKDKISKVIKDLHYKPNILARGLKGKGTKTIGLIISDIREDFFSKITKSIESNANKKGYNVILCDSEEDIDEEKFYIHILLRKGIDGLIFAPVNKNEINKTLVFSHIPSVQIDRKLNNFNADFVGIDNSKSAEKATHHLFDQGYKNIGFIGYEKRVYTMEKRIEGYKKVILERGILEESRIKIISYSDSNIKDTINEWLCKYKDIDAVICGVDNLCYETLAAIEEIGLEMPNDMGIISFDDTKWFRFVKSPITTIRQPTENMGRLAINILIDRIENNLQQEYKDNLLDTELVIRESCLKGT